MADGRENWIGSIEFRRDLIQAPAIENTGRIINELKADALGATVQKTREKYPSLGTVTGDTNAASDHAAVWADFDL